MCYEIYHENLEVSAVFYRLTTAAINFFDVAADSAWDVSSIGVGNECAVRTVYEASSLRVLGKPSRLLDTILPSCEIVFYSARDGELVAKSI
jgi:hypothetical protein